MPEKMRCMPVFCVLHAAPVKAMTFGAAPHARVTGRSGSGRARCATVGADATAGPAGADSAWHGHGVGGVNKGVLLLITGPMFAGKSHVLIARARELGASARMLKPAFDTRDGAAVAASRTGARLPAEAISRWPAALPPTVRTLLVDEAQFLVSPHYEGDAAADILGAVSAGLDVVVGALDTDYLRRPFPVVEALMPHADEREQLQARCHRCGAPARWTAKKSETGQLLELGDDELYEARCDRHWSLPGVPAAGAA
jgi:thymidine kinase